MSGLGRRGSPGGDRLQFGGDVQRARPTYQLMCTAPGPKDVFLTVVLGPLIPVDPASRCSPPEGSGSLTDAAYIYLVAGGIDMLRRTARRGRFGGCQWARVSLPSGFARRGRHFKRTHEAGRCRRAVFADISGLSGRPQRQRWPVHPVPPSGAIMPMFSLPQPCGRMPGSRGLRGVLLFPSPRRAAPVSGPPGPQRPPCGITLRHVGGR